MRNLLVNWQGEYASYDRPETWLPELEKRKLSPWILGQTILANHNTGHFRVRVARKAVTMGSAVRLTVEGITALAPLAILGGRLDGEPLDLFGKIVVPYREKLDALARIPPDLESGTYVFLAQQWEPGGQPAYAGGSLIYPSNVVSVEVKPYMDDKTFWESFEPWPEEDAEEIMKNVRRLRESSRGGSHDATS